METPYLCYLLPSGLVVVTLPCRASSTACVLSCRWSLSYTRASKRVQPCARIVNRTRYMIRSTKGYQYTHRDRHPVGRFSCRFFLVNRALEEMPPKATNRMVRAQFVWDKIDSQFHPGVCVTVCDLLLMLCYIERYQYRLRVSTRPIIPLPSFSSFKSTLCAEDAAAVIEGLHHGGHQPLISH